MESMFEYFMNLRHNPVGRQQFALSGVRRVLVAMLAVFDDDPGAEPAGPGIDRDAIEALVAEADAALAVAEDTHQTHTLYVAGRDGVPVESGEVRQVDLVADRIIAAIYGGAKAFVVNYEAHEALGKASRELIGTLLPNGVAAITQQTFAEQLGSMKAMIKLLDTDFAAHATDLGLGHWVDRLKEVTVEYEAELAAAPDEKVTYPQLSDALRTLRRRTQRLVIKILAAIDEDTDVHEAVRQKILRPIIEQDLAVSELRRRHRRVTDVDPDSGAVVDADAPAPAPTE